MFEGKKIFVADIEANGLLDTITKIWTLGYAYQKPDSSWDLGTTSDYKAIARLFENENNVIIGHNFWLFDVPAVERVLGIKVKAQIVDTLFLAWYLDPNRLKTGKTFGLADYGEDFGTAKVKVEDGEWVGIGEEKEALLEFVGGDESISNLLIEKYKSLPEKEKDSLVSKIQFEKENHQDLMEHRVTEDVKINVKLWLDQVSKYQELYQGEEHLIESHIRFLMSKANTYYEHLHNRMVVDQKLCKSEIERLEGLLKERTDKLEAVMPKVPKKTKKTRPKNPFKKDGEVSATGKRWFDLLDELGLPHDYDGEVEVINKWVDGSANSPKQIKDWLFSLGWEPRIYKKTFSKTIDDFKQVPQVKDKDGNLCKSILKLAETHPQLLEYEQVGVLQHRLSVLKNFLKFMGEDGTVVADIGGLAASCRIQHRSPIVNLPKPSQLYGENIRRCLTAPEGLIMLGSDLSSLESVTKNAFIKPYDPEYVKVMEEDPYYDAHLDIGLVSGDLTENQAMFYKYVKEKAKNPDIKPADIGKVQEDFWEFYNSVEDKEAYHHELDMKRAKLKTTNYSSTYSIGSKALAKDLDISVKEAELMLKAFWERNWAIKQFASDCQTLKAIGDNWVINPITRFRYCHKEERKIFSVVNQGHGDYIFTLWCERLKRLGVKLYAGIHDEIVTCCKPEDKDRIVKLLFEAIEWVKGAVKQDVSLGIDFKEGLNYAEVH